MESRKPTYDIFNTTWTITEINIKDENNENTLGDPYFIIADKKSNKYFYIEKAKLYQHAKRMVLTNKNNFPLVALIQEFLDNPQLPWFVKPAFVFNNQVNEQSLY